MAWFGTHWGAPICDDEKHVATPIGQECFHCEEKIEEGDDGFLEVVVGEAGGERLPIHLECWMRQLLGSASHLMKMCSCYVPGSECGDPPELSKREAARLVVDLVRRGEVGLF